MDHSSQNPIYEGKKGIQQKRNSDTPSLQNNITKSGDQDQYSFNKKYGKKNITDFQVTNNVTIGSQVSGKVLPYQPNLTLYEKIQMYDHQQNITNRIMENVIKERSNIRWQLKKLRRRARRNMQNILHDHTYSQSHLHFPSSYTGIIPPTDRQVDSEIEDLLAEIM